MNNDQWSHILDQLYQNSCGVFIGIFKTDGTLVYANKGMQKLLDLDNSDHRPVDYFVNPSFNDCVNIESTKNPIFEGVLTTGNSDNIHRSINARIFRIDEQLLFFGEYDVLEMDQITTQLSTLTQELANTQRILMKEKKTLKRTLDELTKTQAMLIHSEKMSAMGQMVAGIAHEINNPISYIISNLFNLKQSFIDVKNAYTQLEQSIDSSQNDQLSESAQQIREDHDIDYIFDDFDDLYHAIDDGIHRVKEIVQDLRTFSRLDESDLKEIDIKESLEKTLALVQPEITRKGIAIQLQLSDLPLFNCFASELNQVFLNLIINAIQAMETGGKLTISGESTKDSIHLKFIDTGIGISDNDLDKIFNPFFTTKPVGKGTGLGLSLAHTIVYKKHGGCISVQSKLNEGTTFSIILPKDFNK